MHIEAAAYDRIGDPGQRLLHRGDPIVDQPGVRGDDLGCRQRRAVDLAPQLGQAGIDPARGSGGADRRIGGCALRDQLGSRSGAGRGRGGGAAALALQLMDDAAEDRGGGSALHRSSRLAAVMPCSDDQDRDCDGDRQHQRECDHQQAGRDAEPIEVREETHI